MKDWIDRINKYSRIAWKFIKVLAELVWIMISVTVTSLYHGVDYSRDEIAKGWQKKIIEWGNLTTDRLPLVFRISRIIALVVIVIFWVVLVELTVLVISILF